MGPKFSSTSKGIRYAREDIAAWLERRPNLLAIKESVAQLKTAETVLRQDVKVPDTVLPALIDWANAIVERVGSRAG